MDVGLGWWSCHSEPQCLLLLPVHHISNQTPGQPLLSTTTPPPGCGRRKNDPLDFVALLAEAEQPVFEKLPARKTARKAAPAKTLLPEDLHYKVCVRARVCMCESAYPTPPRALWLSPLQAETLNRYALRPRTAIRGRSGRGDAAAGQGGGSEEEAADLGDDFGECEANLGGRGGRAAGPVDGAGERGHLLSFALPGRGGTGCIGRPAPLGSGPAPSTSCPTPPRPALRFAGGGFGGGFDSDDDDGGAGAAGDSGWADMDFGGGGGEGDSMDSTLLGGGGETLAAPRRVERVEVNYSRAAKQVCACVRVRVCVCVCTRERIWFAGCNEKL